MFIEAKARKGLRSLPYFSAPGPHGLEPSILQLTAHPPGETDPSRSAVSALTAFCDHCSNEDLPDSKESWLESAKPH